MSHNPGVYFMYDSLSNEVKIGKANNPYKRMQQARTFNPRVLLLTVIPCANPYQLEKYLHRLFADEHNVGEWFHYSDRIKNYLKYYEQEEDRKRQQVKQKEIITPRTTVQTTVVGSESFLPW